MRTITIEVTNDTARTWEWLLRSKYGKDKRTSLDKLCGIAIGRAALEQAQAEYTAAQALDEPGEKCEHGFTVSCPEGCN
jgi:hypothetical protein